MKMECELIELERTEETVLENMVGAEAQGQNTGGQGKGGVEHGDSSQLQKVPILHFM